MSKEILLRAVTEADLPIFFEQQLDHDANYMAAFTHPNPADQAAFTQHWAKILQNPTVIQRTILHDGQVAGYVGSYEQDGQRDITYWLGKEFWGQGLASLALTAYLQEVIVRPIYGRVASDNLASRRVMEKGGFTIYGHARGFANARSTEIEETLLVLN